MDAFIGALIDELEAFDEPTVLVLYGDHLPALGLEADDLSTGDLYQTTYVLWNNFGLDMQGGDLQAFQLSAYVLGQLNIHEGILTRFHQNFGPDCDEEDYLSFLRVLEYDMLYGDHNIYEGGSPYQPTALKLAPRPSSAKPTPTIPAPPPSASTARTSPPTATSSSMASAKTPSLPMKRASSPAPTASRRKASSASASSPARATSWAARDLEKCVKFRRNAL